MQKKSGFIIIAVQSGIIVMLLVYFVFTIGDTAKIEMLEDRIVSMEELHKTCIKRNDSLSTLLQEIRITRAIPPFLDKRQVEDLEKKGLNNPVENLRNDLISDPDLIGTSPVLGGEMGFYFRDGIHILNKKWVFAYFEDGHIAGALLLRYEIEHDGHIRWEVIDEIIY